MKTKNVLLSAGRMTAKIADVGLARFMAQTHMDTKSLPMGTFVYAAPELLLGKRSDHKVCCRRQLHERKPRGPNRVVKQMVLMKDCSIHLQL